MAAAGFSDVWKNLPAEEVTYDWYAQDSEKNIWYMGEDTFDGVGFAGSFFAGCDGAEQSKRLLPREGVQGALYP
jgi:hypothetical protein